MNEDKTIIRKAKDKENPYVMIAKTAIQDENISLKATGLLCFILSLPDDWIIYVEELTRHKQDGKQSFRTAIKELISVGYAEKITYRNDKGQFVKHEYIIHETPEICQQNQPQTRNPKVGGRQLLNTDSTNNEGEDKSQKSDPQYYTNEIYRNMVDSVH